VTSKKKKNSIKIYFSSNTNTSWKHKGIETD